MVWPGVFLQKINKRLIGRGRIKIPAPDRNRSGCDIQQALVFNPLDDNLETVIVEVSHLGYTRL